MAEAVAVISLLSSIIQLVDFGTKLIDRLDEFVSATEDVPLSFRSIKSQLPLAIITLRRVEEQARSGRVSDVDAQALKPVIDNSLDETKKLTGFLDSAVPAGSFSTFQKRLQALKSLRYDKKVQKCAERLQANVQVLIFHQTTNHSDLVEHIRDILSKLTVSPAPQPPNFSLGLNLGRAPEVAEGAFVGRQAEVIQLDQWLSPQWTVPRQSVAAIVGLGGLGKTHLSITFAKQYHDKYSAIFWLNAKDELSLKQEFVRVSQIIGIDQGSGSTGSANEDLVVQQVLRWLSRPENTRWLIMFDNYDDPRFPGIKSPTGYDIRDYFPSRSQGSILITTRSHRLTFARQLKLAKLQDLNESIEILSSRSGRDLRGSEDFLIALIS
jgi:N-terminal domain on NACHT_NTPase and P-loop NTPases